jgi:hypothetical protein
MRARRAPVARDSGVSEGSDDDGPRSDSGSTITIISTSGPSSGSVWRRQRTCCALALLGATVGAVAWVQQTSKVTSWTVLRRGLVGLYFSRSALARATAHPHSPRGNRDAGAAILAPAAASGPPVPQQRSSSSYSSSSVPPGSLVSPRCRARPNLPWPLSGGHSRADVNSNGEETDDWHVSVADAPLR